MHGHDWQWSGVHCLCLSLIICIMLSVVNAAQSGLHFTNPCYIKPIYNLQFARKDMKPCESMAAELNHFLSVKVYLSDTGQLWLLWQLWLKVTHRYQDVDIAVVLPIVCPDHQPEELLLLPVDGAQERQVARPRVDGEGVPVATNNGVLHVTVQVGVIRPHGAHHLPGESVLGETDCGEVFKHWRSVVHIF